jgi:hypothetical protein
LGNYIDHDPEDIDGILNKYIEEHLKIMNDTIHFDTELKKSTDPAEIGWKFPTEHIVPLLLKQTYDSQKLLKKSQDNLNILTIILILCTIVLAVLTGLLYFKG